MTKNGKFCYNAPPSKKTCINPYDNIACRYLLDSDSDSLTCSRPDNPEGKTVNKELVEKLDDYLTSTKK